MPRLWWTFRRPVIASERPRFWPTNKFCNTCSVWPCRRGRPLWVPSRPSSTRRQTSQTAANNRRVVCVVRRVPCVDRAGTRRRAQTRRQADAATSRDVLPVPARRVARRRRPTCDAMTSERRSVGVLTAECWPSVVAATETASAIQRADCCSETFGDRPATATGRSADRRETRARRAGRRPSWPPVRHGRRTPASRRHHRLGTRRRRHRPPSGSSRRRSPQPPPTTRTVHDVTDL